MSFKTFMAIIVFAQLASADEGTGWDSEWFSEEKGGWSSFRGFAITGIMCGGSMCDNKKLYSDLSLVLAGEYDISTQSYSEEHGPSNCPVGYVLAGLQCSGGHCDNMWRYCQRPSNFQITHETKYAEIVHSRTSEKYCPEGYVANGFTCMGSHCGAIQFRCVKYVNVVEEPVYGEAKCTWSHWFSEEKRTKLPFKNMGTVAIRCNGGFCDNLSMLQCNQLAMKGAEEKNGKEFSEEHGESSCPRNKIVSGIECFGWWCDNKKLSCRKPNERFFELLDGNKKLSIEFSEEGGAMGQCADGYVLTGLKCRGHRCDRLTLICKPYQVNGLPISCLHKDSNGQCQGYGFASGYWKQACLSNGRCTTSLETGYSTTKTESKTTHSNSHGFTQNQADLFKNSFTHGYGYNTCGGVGSGSLVRLGHCHPMGTDVNQLGLKVGPAHASIGQGGVRANVGNLAAASVGPDGVKASVLGGFASASVGPNGIQAKLGFLNLNLGSGRRTSIGNSIANTISTSTTKTTKQKCEVVSPKQCEGDQGCSTWQWVNVAEDREGDETSLASCSFHHKWNGNLMEAPNCMPGWCAADGECNNCKKPDDGFDPRIDDTKGKLIPPKNINEDLCLNGEGHLYTLVKRDHWFTGDSCGHSSPGDWKYGKCKSTDARYRICNGKEGCKRAGITTADDCAKAVATGINEGNCDPTGIFYTAACSSKTGVCICKHANIENTYKPSTYGNSVLKVRGTATKIEEKKEEDVVCVQEQLSSFEQNNFDDRGNEDLYWQGSYEYKLSNGYTADLSGWTHSRNFAKGFITNRKKTNPQAKISGLEPNQHYLYKIYQYASKYAGTNGFTAPGASEIMTTSSKSDAATASGSFTSDNHGEALFQFRRITHHVHLSAISIARDCVQADVEMANGDEHEEDHWNEDQLAENFEMGSNFFYNLFAVGAVCLVAFGIGNLVGNYHSNKSYYKPLNDEKCSIELE